MIAARVCCGRAELTLTGERKSRERRMPPRIACAEPRCAPAADLNGDSVLFL
jgi:hypothetical protein